MAYGTVARDKDGCTVGFKLPVSVDVHDLYKYTRCFDVREEDGKWFNCYLVYKGHQQDGHERIFTPD